MALRHSRHPMAPSWRWLLLVAFALLLILLTARAAAAENLGPGGSRVIVGDEVMGSYRLLVTSAWADMDAAARSADPHAGQTFELGIAVKGRFEPSFAL